MEQSLSQWNRFRNTSYSDQKFYFEYNFVVETQRLGLFQLNKKKEKRIKLIYQLHQIGFSNKNISIYLNFNNLRTLNSKKEYTTKMVWGIINKYKKRLYRNIDKIIWIKESINMSVSKDIRNKIKKLILE